MIQELGTRKDYDHSYPNQPLGLTARRLTHMELKAAQDAFAEFICSNALLPTT